MNSTTIITLDLQSPAYATVYASQDDILTRHVTANLTSNHQPWTIPENAYMQISFIKPDGHAGLYDTDENGDIAYTFMGTAVDFVIAQQAVSVAGHVRFALHFYNNSGEVLSTFTFCVIVPSAPWPYQQIASDNYFNVMSSTLETMARQAQLVKAGYGAPLTASTLADMTDTSHVYVYTGSESGMTNGDWYYYDGHQWQRGGVYNSVAFDTDTTLSVPDMAADAEVVGEALYMDKTRSTNIPAGLTYFDITQNFSSTTPAGPADIPENSYCSAYGSILAGFNNSLFTLDIELEYNVFQITSLSTLTRNRSKIYILNAEEKQFYVVDFRRGHTSYFYYDLSPRNYIPLPSDAQSGDYLAFNGTSWVPQPAPGSAIPYANGVDF